MTFIRKSIDAKDQSIDIDVNDGSCLYLKTENGNVIHLSFVGNEDHSCMDIQHWVKRDGHEFRVALKMVGFARGKNSFDNRADEEETTTCSIMLGDEVRKSNEERNNLKTRFQRWMAQPSEGGFHTSLFEAYSRAERSHQLKLEGIYPEYFVNKG